MVATETVRLGCFLHGWIDINAENYRDRVDFERCSRHWSNSPRVLVCPAGWHTAQCRAGSIELFDAAGKHVTLLVVAGHQKSVQAATADGPRWLALREDDDVSCCCPTCGQSV